MGVLLGVLLAGVSAVLLPRVISGFRTTWRTSVVTRGPAVAEQTLHFPEGGSLSVCLEGPRYRTYQRRLGFVLNEATTGSSIPITPVFTGAGVRSPRRSLVHRGRVQLPGPGDYTLRIEGGNPDDASEYEIVFMRLFTGTLIRFILTCVALGFALIGGLVLAILSALL